MGLLFGIVDALRGGKMMKGPVLGFVNLARGEGRTLMVADRAALGNLFATVRESEGTAPTCDVLFVYARVREDGTVQGAAGGALDAPIRESGAKIVVYAMDAPGEHYRAAEEKSQLPPTNLVLTLKRKGRKFVRFYHQLFTYMLNGAAMPEAWVKISPQIPGMQHDTPDAVYSSGLTAYRFRR